MTDLQWRGVLGEVSRAILAKDNPQNEDVNRPRFSPEIHAAGYLGFEGASEAEISTAEVRLGVPFPPSYRAFLRVTNGWPTMWHSVEPGRLWRPEELFWLRDSDPHDTLKYWSDIGNEVTPQQHLDYRDQKPHDSSFYRDAYVPGLLCISDQGDECSLFLSPEVIDENGEWECWTFAAWGCGATRWKNFETWFRKTLEFHRKVE